MESPPPKELPRAVLDAAVDLIAGPGRIALLPMTGESMLPTLRPGQRVAVELVVEGPERGDLLLFRQVDYHVVHRYLGPTTSGDGVPCFRTRGDHVPALDAPLDPARVLGRVIAVEREGEWWDLDGAAARLYALGAALHDLFWAAAALAAGRLEARWGAREGLLRERVVAWDRRLLGLAHRLFLRLGSRKSGALSARPGAR